MGIRQLELAVPDPGKAIFKVGFAFSQRFHLSSRQRNAGLELLLNMKIMVRLAVRRNRLLFASHRTIIAQNDPNLKGLWAGVRGFAPRTHRVEKMHGGTSRAGRENRKDNSGGK